MIQIFSKPELRSFKRIGIDFGKQTFKRKEEISNEKFTHDFSPVFRQSEQIKQNPDALLKLTEKQLEVCNLLNSKEFLLCYGGSRSGKTVLILLKLIYECLSCPNTKVLIVRQNFSDIKKSLVDDTLLNFIMSTYELEVKINLSSPIKITFKNNSYMLFVGIEGGTKATGVDKHLGTEFSKIYLNEASQISYHTFKILQTRLNSKKGSNNRTQIILDCNPPSTSHWLYKYFILGINPETEINLGSSTLANLGHIQVNPIDNLENLGDGERYLDRIKEFGGAYTKRFLLGEFSNNSEYSIFKEHYFCYEEIDLSTAEWDELVIGVDPAVKSGEHSDETGIILCGLKKENDKLNYYVLRDFSGKHTSDQWLKKVIEIYNSFSYKQVRHKKTIVIETNNGGDLLRNSLRDANNKIMPKIKEVHSKASKYDRALLIARLYEQGLVVHASVFSKLEGQMNSLGADLYMERDDRVDALVHSLTYLFNLTQKPKSILDYQ